MFKEYLSLVIPAYNEAKRLPASLDHILSYLSRHFENFEIIIVDDGSRDETVGIVKHYQQKWPQITLLENRKNGGKGVSVKRGMLAARGELVFFTDADLSTPIETLSECIIRFYRDPSIDVIIGTRKVAQANVIERQPFYRVLMGKTFTWMANAILRTALSDFTCGFKGFRRHACHEIFSRQTLQRWAFDVEILFIARLLGLKTIELPVQWTNSRETKVNLLQDAFYTFCELLNIRIKSWRGEYKTRLTHLEIS